MKLINVTSKTLKRFHRKVLIKAPNECWPWQAAIDSRGYGQFYFSGTMKSAHRIAFLIARGWLPEDGVIMHTCDYKRCVNPRHLQAGTQRENVLDAIQKDRWGALRYLPSVVLALQQARTTGISYRLLDKQFDLPCGSAWQLLNKERYVDAIFR